MEDKNQLNDIVLNKNSGTTSKKIVLAVAVLMVLLIIVIVLVNAFSSSSHKGGVNGINKEAQLPKPPAQSAQAEDQLFKPAKVVQEDNNTNNTLDKIAQKLKAQNLAAQKQAQSMQPVQPVQEPVEKVVPKPKPKPIHTAVKKPATHVSANARYIQVAAFTRFKPNKKFLEKIKQNGYKIEYYKMNIKGKEFTKLLVGPYKSDSAAREALVKVRKEINPHAFILRK
jgi:DedD protein